VGGLGKRGGGYFLAFLFFYKHVLSVKTNLSQLEYPLEGGEFLQSALYRMYTQGFITLCDGLHICVLIDVIFFFPRSVLDFGNRPRKLFVVVNPESGGGASQVEKTWRKVQHMFQLANIHVDVLSELMRGQGKWVWSKVAERGRS